MTKYAILATELVDDPLGRGYTGMSDADVAASLNAVDRTKNRTAISGDEAFQATHGADFVGLAAAARTLWLAFCGRSEIDPFAQANVDFVTWVFSGASQTVTNLAAIRIETISRAQELGLPPVSEKHVTNVRAM